MSAALQSANSGAATALSVPKRQSPEPGKKANTAEEGIPPQHPHPPPQLPVQPVQDNEAKDDSQPRARRGLAGLSNRPSVLVTDSRDSFEDDFAIADSGRIIHPAGAADAEVPTGSASEAVALGVHKISK